MEFKFVWILNTELVWIEVKRVMIKLCFLQEWSKLLFQQHCFALVHIRSLTCGCKGDPFSLNTLPVQGTILTSREIDPFLPQYLEVVWKSVLTQYSAELTKQPQDLVQVTPWGLEVTENCSSLLLSRKWKRQWVIPVVLETLLHCNSDSLWNDSEIFLWKVLLLFYFIVLPDRLWERHFIVFVQNRPNPFAQCTWALENMKGSEDILWDLTWSKRDYKFIIHLGDSADFLSSLSGLWTACNFIVDVRLMLDKCFKQNLWCLGSICLTHWDVFILYFMVYITNYGIYIPFPDRLTISPLN